MKFRGVITVQEEHFLETTGTFGPTLEDREFTDDEKVILNYFFTNIDKNIYAAKDSMPNTLWALLEGGYSRSQVSMRMRFLQIFEDMQKDFDKGKISEDELITIKDFAENIRSSNNIDLSFFLSKAEKFMRKWAVQYGHDSLKDSDVVRFAIENTTQWATSPIEEARLGAYQEKSTRYVEFSRDHLTVPTDLKEFEQEIRKWNNLLISNYEESREIVQNFFSNLLDETTFKSQAAFKRTLEAKTFDVIRYFLPNTMLTSLGVVWPTREAERHISRLLSDSSQELRSIGKALLEEGKKVTPGLLSHVAVNEYQIQQREDIQRIHQSIILPSPEAEAGRLPNAVTLISVSENIEPKIAAAILFQHNYTSNTYQQYLEACLKDNLLTQKTINTSLQSRGKFDSFSLPTETGNLLFHVTMDLGAYRDLKRHRRNLFLYAPITALAGFEYPEFVKDSPELNEVKEMIEHCAQETTKLHKKIKSTHAYPSSYVSMFAHKQHVLWQMDPRQLAYISELRTTPAGHHSYRHICQEMFKAAEKHLPILSKHIRVNFSSAEQGRKKQEERTVEKLQALGGDLHKLT